MNDSIKQSLTNDLTKLEELKKNDPAEYAKLIVEINKTLIETNRIAKELLQK